MIKYYIRKIIQCKAFVYFTSKIYLILAKIICLQYNLPYIKFSDFTLLKLKT